MYGRLAFAVAVSMEPDIPLVDEALSTGDAAFRRKSFRKMRQLCRQARTIVLVSHSMASIRDLCDSVIWMHKGELKMHGEPDEVIKAYTDFFEVDEDDPALQDEV